jgi:hypothetical protein
LAAAKLIRTEIINSPQARIKAKLVFLTFSTPLLLLFGLP